MSAEGLSAIAGVLLSLCFSYIPGVKDWFGELSKQYKQSLMGVLLIVVAGASFGVACTGVYDVGVACTQAGAIGLVETLIAALVANQSTYLITRK
jgi:hypothetical protein